MLSRHASQGQRRKEGIIKQHMRANTGRNEEIKKGHDEGYESRRGQEEGRRCPNSNPIHYPYDLHVLT